MAAEVGGCGTNMPRAANLLVIFAASGINNPNPAFNQQFTRRRWLEIGVTAIFWPHTIYPRPFSYYIFDAAYVVFLPPYMYILPDTCVFLPRAPFVEKFLVNKKVTLAFGPKIAGRGTFLWCMRQKLGGHLRVFAFCAEAHFLPGSIW
jgi:hypothetical protein